MDIWRTYIIVYTLLSLGYVIYRYAFLFTSKKVNGDYKGKYSVIIPYFNEELDLLEKTIRSVNNANGEKEIIVVDDGSPKLECWNLVNRLKKEINLKAIRYENNKGKRHAQAIGLKECSSEIIITIDSDTTFDKDAFINLIKPFSNKKIGATTGNLQILNENDNWLTKMISARYWNAFNYERKSQSNFCGIICCTGPLSAYRKELLDKVVNDYTTQEFLGKKCTYGDDRHLTTLILKEGYQVIFCEDSIGYTYSPKEFSKFLKQQVRWKKSWLRENYLMSKYIWKKDKKIAIELFLTSGLVFISLPLRVMFLYLTLTNPFYFISILPIFSMIILMQSAYMLTEKPKYIPYIILYALFYVFIFYWLLFYALANLKDTKWGTR